MHQNYHLFRIVHIGNGNIVCNNYNPNRKVILMCHGADFVHSKLVLLTFVMNIDDVCKTECEFVIVFICFTHICDSL